MQFNISKAELKAALNSVKGSIQKNEARPNLAGVNVQNIGKQIQFQATNGHTLARYRAPVEMLSGKDNFLITPDQIKTVLAACKGKAGDVVTVTTSATACAIDAAGIKDFRIEKPDVSKFPTIDAIVPKSFDYSLDFSHAELKAALKAVALASDEKIKPCGLRFDAVDYVTFQSERMESGEIDWRMDEVGNRPDGGGIGFNAAYVLTALAALKCDSVRLSFNGPLQPLQFSNAELHDGHLFWLVMPLRIEWLECKFSGEAPVKANRKVEPVKPVIVTARDTLATDLETETVPATLKISEYSEKALIITGCNWKDHYLRIKFAVPKAHGVWHRGAGGWLFSKRHEAAIRAALADVLAA